MDTEIPARLRASDGDRERVAATIQAAGAEGRLTLEEVEDRLGTVYATRFTDELGELTTDLPRPRPERRPFAREALRRPALRVHLGVVAVLVVLLIVRWAVGGAGFFWPAMPVFWLSVSVLAHARAVSFRERRGAAVPY
ncbi:DUF1707 domain-containing protein [Amycolatopsis sp. PS_44_ISF1]|uniref:DUF1707 SHOCT-like domain-containing protein n=1 Tax=Amycolatopsis sp. PS_44_ISF1 TaxID=2974917 RepID=UPI0028DD5814|nr:DUF1707 domain-containing protein [Amycolatopsis sp. PS_44_ISF1]MDT8909634.1 DUF1707 domain-containing protein [Amycolatopsis sp. PS_44_ISF1]